jgi:hypothetical protein
VPAALYRNRYPELSSLDAYYGPPGGPAIVGAAFHGVPPEGNVIARNVCLGKWLETGWHAKPESFDVRANFVTQDPAQIAAPAEGFRLPKNSPAWKLGFVAIPFDRIGPQPDDDRERLERWRKAAMVVPPSR